MSQENKNILLIIVIIIVVYIIITILMNTLGYNNAYHRAVKGDIYDKINFIKKYDLANNEYPNSADLFSISLSMASDINSIKGLQLLEDCAKNDESEIIRERCSDAFSIAITKTSSRILGKDETDNLIIFKKNGIDKYYKQYNLSKKEEMDSKDILNVEEKNIQILNPEEIKQLIQEGIFTNDIKAEIENGNIKLTYCNYYPKNDRSCFVSIYNVDSNGKVNFLGFK